MPATWTPTATCIVTDRIKDLIICSGYNVYPRVIEDALYEHPAVAEAIVIGIADSYRGQAPLAFVTLRAGHSDRARSCGTSCATGSRRSNCRCGWKSATALPKTMIGKLSRKELVAEMTAPKRRLDVQLS